MPDLRNDPDAAFGFHVERMRKDRGWSYRELSERSGTAHSHLWRVEHGGGVTLRHALAIAAAFGVPLPVLLAPAACATCLGQPPAGFICQDCNTRGPERSGRRLSQAVFDFSEGDPAA